MRIFASRQCADYARALYMRVQVRRPTSSFWLHWAHQNGRGEPGKRTIHCTCPGHFSPATPTSLCPRLSPQRTGGGKSLV